MCNGSAAVASIAPRVEPMIAADDGETHLALSRNFASCGAFRPQRVTSDPRLTTCHGCQLSLLDAQEAA